MDNRQRLEETRGLLEAILQSTDPRAQSVIADLRRNAWSRNIIDNMHTEDSDSSGSYSRSSGEEAQPVDSDPGREFSVQSPQLFSSESYSKDGVEGRGGRQFAAQNVTGSLTGLFVDDQEMTRGVNGSRDSSRLRHEPVDRPISADRLDRQESTSARLPPSDVLERLLSLYFTYVNPTLPVLNKALFMEEYNDRSTREVNENLQTSDLLLLSVLSMAVHYDSERGSGEVSSNATVGLGEDYAAQARTLLIDALNMGDISLCQAALILSYREIGIGAYAAAALYLGLAIQIAKERELHRMDVNSSHWTLAVAQINAAEAVQQKIGRQIWWTCCILDKYVAVFTKQRTYIRSDEIQTILPDRNPQPEDAEPWQPYPCSAVQAFQPIPSLLMACFRAQAALCMCNVEFTSQFATALYVLPYLHLAKVLDAIVEIMYAVRPQTIAYQMQRLPVLEGELETWSRSLPVPLQYDIRAAGATASLRGAAHPPHVLQLHAEYWHAVLVLHRAFVFRKHSYFQPSSANDPASRLSRTAFQKCSEAADYIVRIAAVYRHLYEIRQCCPFMVSYLHAAGIIHVSKGDWQSLEVCLSGLHDLQIAWPNARNAREELDKAAIEFRDDSQG